MKRPSFQFYPGDWQNDHKLRACSPVARCLWIEMLCIFHQSDVYGCMPSFLLNQIPTKDLTNRLTNGLSKDRDLLNHEVNYQVNYKVEAMVALCLPIIPDLAQMTSMKEEDVKVGLTELFRRKIPDVSEGGLIYSKRMVRDENIRQVRAASGKKGGNPQLLKARQEVMSKNLLNQNPTKDLTKDPTKELTKGPTKGLTKGLTNAPSKAPSKIQPLHLQSSKENIKEPPISPHGVIAIDQAVSDANPPPQPPGGGHCRPFESNGENPDLQDDVSSALDVLFGAAGGDAPEAPTEPDASAAQPPARKGRAPLPSVTFRTWLAATVAAGEDAIPAADPVFQYAETAGIPDEFLRLQWHEFKARYSTNDKRYKDWREVFRKSVRGNWFRIWALREGQDAMLTTAGVQANRVMQASETVEAA